MPAGPALTEADMKIVSRAVRWYGWLADRFPGLDTKDLSQEAVLAVWKHACQNPDEPRSAAMVACIAKRAIFGLAKASRPLGFRNQPRGGKSARVVPIDQCQIAAASTEPAAIASLDLASAVATLNPIAADTVALWLEGTSPEEAAARQGVTVGGAKKRRRTAFAALRPALPDYRPPTPSLLETSPDERT